MAKIICNRETKRRAKKRSVIMNHYARGEMSLRRCLFGISGMDDSDVKLSLVRRRIEFLNDDLGFRI